MKASTVNDLHNLTLEVASLKAQLSQVLRHLNIVDEPSKERIEAEKAIEWEKAVERSRKGDRLALKRYLDKWGSAPQGGKA